MDLVKFGERLRQARKAAHMTQAKLGEELGLTGPYISSIERGVCAIGIEIFLQLCLVLNKEPDELLCDSVTHTQRAKTRPNRLH